MPARRIEDGKPEWQTGPEPELAAQASASEAGGAADGVGESATAVSRLSFTSPEWKKSIEETKPIRCGIEGRAKTDCFFSVRSMF
ncbi:hypothetical protein [Bradyrhizobium arachidis]|uniref:hypothetical protein n=1 Tax=Bradyrhizobium arachidis TaxID=858423 RepID=UPI002161ABF9|nr:hypothetical protein [Bradyrhizobium arachidis]